MKYGFGDRYVILNRLRERGRYDGLELASFQSAITVPPSVAEDGKLKLHFPDPFAVKVRGEK